MSRPEFYAFSSRVIFVGIFEDQSTDIEGWNLGKIKNWQVKIWQRNRLAVVGCSWPCISWPLSLAFSDSWLGNCRWLLSLLREFNKKEQQLTNFFCLYHKPLLFIFLKNLLKNSSLRGFLLQNYFINRCSGRCKRLKLNLVSRDSILLPI